MAIDRGSRCTAVPSSSASASGSRWFPPRCSATARRRCARPRRGPRPPPDRPCSRTRSPRGRGSPRARPPGCRATRGTPRRSRLAALRRQLASTVSIAATSSSCVAPMPPRGSRRPYRMPLSQQPEPEPVDQLEDRGVAGRMYSAPISTTAPFGSFCDHTRPPRAPRLQHDDLRAARNQLIRGDEPARPAPTTTALTRGRAGSRRDRQGRATASTAVAPRSWTGTGFSSSSSSPLATSSSPAATASRPAAAVSTGWRRVHR